MKKVNWGNVFGACLVFIFIFLLIANAAKAETVYCIADKLNGRYAPSTKSDREICRFLFIQQNCYFCFITLNY